MRWPALKGRFVTIEASDAGVFTGGQGQWIAASGAALQKVLALIKSRRSDLFDRYCLTATGAALAGCDRGVLPQSRAPEDITARALPAINAHPTPQSGPANPWTLFFAAPVEKNEFASAGPPLCSPVELSGFAA